MDPEIEKEIKAMLELVRDGKKITDIQIMSKQLSDKYSISKEHAYNLIEKETHELLKETID